ncbi:MAG: hypothetical protein H7Z19_06030 [Chitinophagaceae bacterium]|nr:hypothetical protein [Rubrivivax sp.]
MRFGRRGWARSLHRLLTDAAIAKACRQQAARMERPGASPDRISDLVEALAQPQGRAAPDEALV